MFNVSLALCRDPRYHPLTVRGPEYLYTLAAFIARSVPDVEVRARLGSQRGDEVVFRGEAVAEDGIDLF